MAEERAGSITIVGLGPGDADLISRRSWQILSEAAPLYLRTARHPAAEALAAGQEVRAFDGVYDKAEAFADVYEQIVSTLLQAARTGEHVVYGVPGDPLVGEATVTELVEAARNEEIEVVVLPGISFVEPLLAALNIDALNGLQLFDAISVAGYNYPPVNPDFPLVLGQVYSRLVANDLKLTLMAVYPDDHPVTLVHRAGSEAQRLENVRLYEIDRSDDVGPMTTLYVPPLQQSSSLQALAEASAVLRSPEGCPWDREQTPQSLRAGFLEEVAEVLEALDADDADAVREEMGDVLFHIVMQAQMAREEELFRLSDVISGIHEKIVRRHPHVWGDREVEDSAEVVSNWEAIKADEKGRDVQDSLLTGIPRQLPSLARSQKIQGRVQRVGFDWPAVEGVYEKLAEEVEEVKMAETPARRADEVGDLLFAAVNLARWLDVDAESALREANARFVRRFQFMEKLAGRREIDLAQADLDMLEQLWQEAKQLVEQEREG